MRTPDILTTLVDHGIIDEVVRPLMSGKEAQIYLVSSGGEQRVAKIYKDAQNRSFQNRADYTEGRKVRNSRDQRAMSNRSRHGKAQNESAWKSAEVSMIYRLRDAGVRVPTPYHFIDGVLIMELVTDAEGGPAARLGDLTFEPDEATQIFQQVIGEVVRMLCAGVVHGDLSDFNILMSADGPVIIDFPQAVDASSNQNAKKLLLRDVDNLHRFHAKFAPLVQPLPYAQEMWDLYQRMALTPETRLTGKFRVSQKTVNTADVLSLIADADRDEQRRREGLARALRPGTRDVTPAARQRDGRAAPLQGDRAPGAGRGHGQLEQRRPERSAVPAAASRQRAPERPNGTERTGVRHDQRSFGAAHDPRAPRTQQQPRAAHASSQRDGQRPEGGRAFAPRTAAPADEKPRGARAQQQHDARMPQGDRSAAPQQTSRDGRTSQHQRGEWRSQGDRSAAPQQTPRDARTSQQRDEWRPQGDRSAPQQTPRDARTSQQFDEHRSQGARFSAPQQTSRDARTSREARTGHQRDEPRPQDTRMGSRAAEQPGDGRAVQQADTRPPRRTFSKSRD